LIIPIDCISPAFVETPARQARQGYALVAVLSTIQSTMSVPLSFVAGLLAWAIAVPEAAAQAPGSGTARLSGRVRSTFASAIADAIVTLTPIDASPQQTVSATTDPQGGFSFERLAAGRYRLAASRTGYTNRQPLRAPADRFEIDREVTIGPGDQASRVELTLYRESSIAGRVAEPDGIPAPDVQVFAAVRRGNGHVLLHDTRTFAAWDGRYRIDGLPPGEYLVVVLPGTSTDPNRMRANAERRAPESSSATRPFFEPTLYPGVTTDASAETIAVFEGVPVAGIDTWLMPGERHSISGRVLWPDGITAENIVIEYANLTANRTGLWTVPEPGDLFRITGVPRGTVVLLARGDSNRGPLAGVATTEVNVDDIDDLELRLGPPGVVEGRVIYETDVPVAGRATQIALRQRLLPVSPLYPVPESPINADGRFRIENALGLFTFEVAGARIVRVMQHGREIPDGRIRLAMGDAVTGLEVIVGK
jgi:hypothetical protein